MAIPPAVQRISTPDPYRGQAGFVHTVLLVLIACVATLTGSAHAGQTVRVGLYQNSPKIGITAEGRGEGIFIDILEAIAAREGWQIEYVPGSWGEGLARLEAGEIDLMPDVARDTEREMRFLFHDEPVLSSWNQIYTLPDAGVRALPDLAQRRIAVLEGSVQQDQLQQLLATFSLSATLRAFPSYAEAFAAVAAGESDAAVTNRFFGIRHAAHFGLVDTAIIFSPSRLFYAMKRGGDRSLLATIDRHLLAMKADPSSVFFRSHARWTVQAESPKTALPAWIAKAAMLVIGLLIASALWVWMLRRQVRVKTREITQRNEEITRLAHGLEQRVAERTAELADTNRELLTAKHAAESADRLKSAFLATMSHELRTPLNSIIGFTGILLQGLAGPLSNEQAHQLGMVRDSARHLLALINDVLDISKIEAGELRIAHAPFDLAASVEKVAGIVRPLAERKGLTLELDKPPVPCVMTGDARRVEQILLNLLTNAIKFTEHGRATLQLEYPAPSAGDEHIVAGAGPTVAKLTVRDTGMGIRAEDMPLLFQPFRQIDSALSRQHEGTGLGLAICKRLATLMGGDITVESEWGHGSRFTLTLPLDTATASHGRES